MENALVSIILIAIIVFAILTMAYASLGAQEDVLYAWMAFETATEERVNTRLTWVNGASNGDNIDVVLRNEGAVKLADFDRWDVVLQYYSPAGDYYVKWLRYVPGTPTTDEWTVKGIYIDYDNLIAESYEPNVLNPGEEVVLWLAISPPTTQTSTKMVIITVPNGVTLQRTFQN